MVAARMSATRQNGPESISYVSGAHNECHLCCASGAVRVAVQVGAAWRTGCGSGSELVADTAAATCLSTAAWL